MAGKANPVARLLAPVALAAAAIAVIAVIAFAGGGDGGGGGEKQSAGSGNGGAAESTTTGGSDRKTYIVKPGDNLSTIAEETGVSVEELTQINSDIDPQALISGQCVALSDPADCK